MTDTKVYDRQGVIDRYGIPPELVPDFIGLKGDTSDNIPGVPGIGDKTASDLLQRFGDLETVLASVDEISGAKRKQNLTEHADAARLSKQLATMVRDVPVDIDLEVEMTREVDRSGVRPVFRDWELRDPLRRLEEALAVLEMEEIPRPEAAEARTIEAREGTPADVAKLPGEELVLVASPPDIPEGELLPAETRLALRRARPGRRRTAIVGSVEDPAELVAAAGRRGRCSRTRPRRSARSRPTSPSTPRSPRFLLDPARRGFPLDELAEERGIAVVSDDLQAQRAGLIAELAARQREQIAERGLERPADARSSCR